MGGGAWWNASGSISFEVPWINVLDLWSDDNNMQLNTSDIHTNNVEIYKFMIIDLFNLAWFLLEDNFFLFIFCPVWFVAVRLSLPILLQAYTPHIYTLTSCVYQSKALSEAQLQIQPSFHRSGLFSWSEKTVCLLSDFHHAINTSWNDINNDKYPYFSLNYSFRFV